MSWSVSETSHEDFEGQTRWDLEVYQREGQKVIGEKKKVKSGKS
jgi:hypothetical protein